MAKGDIKLNKKHGGKEFISKFQYVGQVKPVQKKDENTDSWFDVEIADTTTTRTGKPRKVTQFIVETAMRNNLKVEVAGMEMKQAFLYSQEEKKTFPVDFAKRHDKSVYPNATYHLIDTDWDKAVKFGEIVKAGMWVDVKGHFEFSSFTTDDGKDINMVKRIIDNVMPLKNGLLEVAGVKDGDTFKVYDASEGGNYLGTGKGKNGEGAKAYIGWLNPEGGKIYISKVNPDGTESARIEQEYNDSFTDGGRFKVTNNLKETNVLVQKPGKPRGEFENYVMDFKDEHFKEVNSFEMQIGIKTTYQDEDTKDTTVNAVHLSYGKEKSEINDVELKVYYKEPADGKDSAATAFSRLNATDFMSVHGIDNNRAEFAMVEVQEQEQDSNPFADLDDEEKIVSYEQATTGTRKGLEILNYMTGTYVKELLSEAEVFGSEMSGDSDDPFSSVEIDEESLPF